MKSKNTKIIASLVAAALTWSSCNDNFLERLPKTSPNETNAFLTYDNYRAYVYPLYGMFTDGRIMTNFSGTYYNAGQWYSDYYAGIMTLSLIHI